LGHHGDVTSIAQVLATCADGAGTTPVIAVAGNHDADGDADKLIRAHALAGGPGVTLATLGGEHVAGVRVAGVHVGRTSGWVGATRREQPAAAAGGDEPLVLISHYPVLSLATTVSDEGFPYPGDLLDRRELAARVSARGAPTVAIGGHVHARATLAQG